MLNPPQIERSVQVWVCDGCGGEDHKSCSCNSAAHAEDLAAKREGARQRKIAQREREISNKNNNAVTRDAIVDNVEELRPRAKNPDFVPAYERRNRRAFILMNCHASAHTARDEMANYKGPVDDEILAACRKVAEAWAELANALEERKS